MIIELVIALILLCTSGCVLNKQALLPGTISYKRRLALEAQEHAVEFSRMRVIESRYFSKEEEIHQKQLESGKESVNESENERRQLAV